MNGIMRKLIYLLSISFVMVFFTSCFEEIDNWYSETAGYDGRFVVAATCEEYSSDDTAIEDGHEVLIYNSAANIENEIWIDTHVAGFPVKGKFKVTGSSLEFKAEETADNGSRSAGISDDDFYILEDGIPVAYPSDLGAPDGLGEEYDAVQLYARLSLEEGKIIPKGATTIGKNISDSVSLKTTMYFDFLVVESYQIPQEEWVEPETPEYDWRIKEGSRHNADGWEEHWTFTGYRYTGFPEDGNPVPPIIEK
jgi:hypothetical protein